MDPAKIVLGLHSLSKRLLKHLICWNKTDNTYWQWHFEGYNFVNKT